MDIQFTRQMRRWQKIHNNNNHEINEFIRFCDETSFIAKFDTVVWYGNTKHRKLKHFSHLWILQWSPHMSFSVNYSAAEQVMRELNFTSRVSVRYDAEACVTRIMRETWQVWGWIRATLARLEVCIPKWRKTYVNVQTSSEWVVAECFM